MSGIIQTIVSLVIAIFISGGVSNMAETTPEEAVQDFIDGISSGQEQVVMSYMDNEYVNFLENVKGSDEEMERLEAALFQNLSYSVTDTAVKGDVAVAKVELLTNDFSKVMDAYEEESYEYVTDNLYDEDVTDKEKLNKKCIDMYLEQVEKAAEEEPSREAEIFVPMEDDGYYGWRIILDDEIMKALMGGLELPVSE